MAYNPSGITFKKLDEATKKGEVYYVVAYWTDLVMEDMQIRRVEYLNKAQAMRAYRKLEEVSREHYIKECIFTADTWEEHARNGLEIQETYLQG
jgi:hypothetical protein